MVVEATIVPFIPQVVDCGGEDKLWDDMGNIMSLLVITRCPLKKLLPMQHWPRDMSLGIYGVPNIG